MLYNYRLNFSLTLCSFDEDFDDGDEPLDEANEEVQHVIYLF